MSRKLKFFFRLLIRICFIFIFSLRKSAQNNKRNNSETTFDKYKQSVDLNVNHYDEKF